MKLKMHSRTLRGQGYCNQNDSKPFCPALVPDACVRVASIFKEKVLSGCTQHSLVCQVQNLIAYSQPSLPFNLVSIYHFQKVFMGTINSLKYLESQGGALKLFSS